MDLPVTFLLAPLLAAQIAATTPRQDVRPVVKVVFDIRDDHPYTLPFGERVTELETNAARKLAECFESHLRFLRFTTNGDAEHTLYLLLDDRDAGVPHDQIREIRLFARMNERATRKNARVSWLVRGPGSDNTRSARSRHSAMRSRTRC